MTMRSASGSWAHEIRRQVYWLVTILITLVAVTAGYNFWSHISIENERERINNHHLVANSHYLRAMEDLRYLQNQPLAADAGDSQADEDMSDAESRNTVLYSLIEKSFQAGLALERRYPDPRFAMLNNKLEQQLLLLSQVAGTHRPFAGDSDALAQVVDRLLITGEQIVRLHTILRQGQLAELREQKITRDYVFYLLVLLMLAIAIIVARRGFVAINRIIRQQVKAEAKIKRQAHYDNLTQLPNRFLALDRLSQMVHEARRNDSRVAVLFLDLDFFKKVNDVLGHINGDRVLVEAAQRIRRSLRAGDTVGRLGGDEFIVLSKDFSRVGEVVRIAENLIKILSDPFRIDGKEIVLTASIGISLYPDDGRQELELIRKADSAMYKAKESGRNTYAYFTASMNRNLSRQLELEEQLQQALERGEFSVAYQPKIDVESRRIVGAEALLRWHNKKLGTSPPLEFLPIAERSGLIIPIGDFVLAEALARTRQWQRDALSHFRISINVSTRQFRDPDLVNNISRALHVSGIASDSLQLEFDESVLMHDYLHIGQALNDLSQLGVSIALDDFGTGFSSLSYLRNYPIDVIKIDRSFITDIDRNPRSLALNDAAISMSHALNISVVAEGVENWAQFDVLQQLNCDFAQGYYFGRPMPAEQLSRLLQLQKREANSGSVVELSPQRKLPPKQPLQK